MAAELAAEALVVAVMEVEAVEVVATVEEATAADGSVAAGAAMVPQVARWEAVAAPAVQTLAGQAEEAALLALATVRKAGEHAALAVTDLEARVAGEKAGAELEVVETEVAVMEVDVVEEVAAQTAAEMGVVVGIAAQKRAGQVMAVVPPAQEVVVRARVWWAMDWKALGAEVMVAVAPVAVAMAAAEAAVAAKVATVMGGARLVARMVEVVGSVARTLAAQAMEGGRGAKSEAAEWVAAAERAQRAEVAAEAAERVAAAVVGVAMEEEASASASLVAVAEAVGRLVGWWEAAAACEAQTLAALVMGVA